MTKNERKQVILLEERSGALQQSIADYLLANSPEATAVRLIGQTHSIPGQYDVQRGMELSDERLYEEVPLGVFVRSGTPAVQNEAEQVSQEIEIPASQSTSPTERRTE